MLNWSHFQVVCRIKTTFPIMHISTVAHFDPMTENNLIS